MRLRQRKPCGRMIALLLLLAPGCLLSADTIPGAPVEESGQNRSPEHVHKRAAPDPLTRLETAIAGRINTVRRKYDLHPLKVNDRLARVAREYSRRMARQHFFRHTAPGGQTLSNRLAAAGIAYRMAGENLYKSLNVRDPAAASVKGWMQSRGHRENILRPEFTETGVGVWREGRRAWATQVFLQPWR